MLDLFSVTSAVTVGKQTHMAVEICSYIFNLVHISHPYEKNIVQILFLIFYLFL